MTSTLNFEGYIANITIDAEAGVIHGEVINTRDVLTFSVEKATDIMKEFEETIQDYRNWCAEDGVSPEKPLSGNLSLRMSPEIHRAAWSASVMAGCSLNNWIVESVECRLGRKANEVTVAQVNERVKAEVVRVLDRRTTVGEDPEAPTWGNTDEVPRHSARPH